MNAGIKMGIFLLVIALFAMDTAAQDGHVNPGFEEPRGSEGSFTFVETMPGWRTTDEAFEIWSTGFMGVKAHEGTQFVELNAHIDGTLYQDSHGISAGSALEFTFAHRGRNAQDTMKLTITDLGADNQIDSGDDTVLFTKQYSTGKDAWAVYDSTTEPRIKALGNTVRFAYSAVAGIGRGPGKAEGNFLDAADFGVGVVTDKERAFGLKRLHTFGISGKDSENHYLGMRNNGVGIPNETDPDSGSIFVLNVQKKGNVVVLTDKAGKYLTARGKDVFMADTPEPGSNWEIRDPLKRELQVSEGWFSLESANDPGRYLRHYGLRAFAHTKEELNASQAEHFLADASWRFVDTAADVPHNGETLSSQTIKFELPDDPVIQQTKQWGMLSKDETRANFVTVIPDMVLETVRMRDGNTYARPTFELITSPGEAGAPSNPSSSAMIQGDPGYEYKVVIDEVSWYEHPGAVDLAPVQSPVPGVVNLDGTEPEIPFAKDDWKYQVDQFSNVQPVTIGDSINIRGKEYFTVTFNPVSYNPAKQSLRVGKLVRWHIVITPPNTPRPKSEIPFEPAQEGIFDVRVPDRDQAAGGANDRNAGSGAKTSVPRNLEPGAKPSAIAGIAANAAEADYLIITPDRFLDEIEPLALWKHQKGFKTYVATLSEVGGATETAIKDYIKAAVNNGTLTTYVLLVGDHEELPAVKMTGHPHHDPYDLTLMSVNSEDQLPKKSKRERDAGLVVVAQVDGKVHVRIIDKNNKIVAETKESGKKESQSNDDPKFSGLSERFTQPLTDDLWGDEKWAIIQNAKSACGYTGDITAHIWASDHPYSLVKGTDNYPDVYIGRFSADKEEEVTTMVKKTLAYDRQPSTGNWYRSVLLAGEFQDRDNNRQDHLADRMFMEDLHRIGDFLGPDYDFFKEDKKADPYKADPYNKGFDIKTALEWGANKDHKGDLKYAGQDWKYGARLTPPAVVSASWRKLGQGDATDIAKAINGGVSMVVHRDHGYGGGEGWGAPSFQQANVQELTNQDQLPFVFSLNCATGWFDDLDSFAESWLRHSKGGAVGFAGAARVSYSRYNDCLHVGLFDTFWNDYSDYDTGAGLGIPYRNSWRPAQAVVRAKAFVLSDFGPNSNYAKWTAHFFNYHGDPELSLRTESPESLHIPTLPSLVALQDSSFSVAVIRKGLPCEGALVAITMASGDHHVATTDKSGNARFSFVPGRPGKMTVVATERNSIPFFGEINVAGPSLLAGPKELAGKRFHIRFPKTGTFMSFKNSDLTSKTKFGPVYLTPGDNSDYTKLEVTAIEKEVYLAFQVDNYWTWDGQIRWLEVRDDHTLYIGYRPKDIVPARGYFLTSNAPFGRYLQAMWVNTIGASKATVHHPDHHYYVTGIGVGIQKAASQNFKVDQPKDDSTGWELVPIN